MKKNGGFFVEAESEASVESDPSDGCTVGKAEVCARLSPSLPARVPACPNPKRAPSRIRSGSQASSEMESAVARLDSRNTKPSRISSRVPPLQAPRACAQTVHRWFVLASSPEKFPKVLTASMFFCLSNRPRAAYLDRLNVVHASIVRRLFDFCGSLACAGAALSNACRRKLPRHQSLRQLWRRPRRPSARAWDHSLAEPRAGFGCFAPRRASSPAPDASPEPSPESVASPTPAEATSYRWKAARLWTPRDIAPLARMKRCPTRRYTQPDALIPDQMTAWPAARAGQL